MSWLDSITDQWGGRSGPVRLVVRFVGLTVFLYLLIIQGVFTGPLWVAITTGLAFALAYVVMFLRMRSPFGRLSVVLIAAMMLCGAVVNPQIAFTGSLFFVIGGVILLGQPELPLRVSVPVVAAISVVTVLAVAIERASCPALLSAAFGAAAVALTGAVRRQRTIRERQEKELADRSRELEERNAELVAQTERTRQEAARVAALQERGRIARDLHDLLAHALGGLVVQLDAAEAELERGRTDAAADRLRTSRQLAVDGLREARIAVHELRGEEQPDDQAPVDVVEQLEAAIRGPVGLQVGAALEVVGEPRPVRAAVADALLATAREGLTNINKHAAATAVSITLVFQANDVRLEVVNGLAAPHVAELADSGAGAGLAGLRERLRIAGGTLSAGPEGRRWVLATECRSPYAEADGSVPEGVG